MDALFKKFAEDDLLAADTEDGEDTEYIIEESTQGGRYPQIDEYLDRTTHIDTPPSSSKSSDIPSHTSSSSIIHLNVGGRIYSTTLTTLQYDSSSMLARMFDGLMPTTRDEEGRYFIDRDGKYFRYILNYLRDGYVKVPQNIVEEVLQESRFYGLDELTLQLEDKLPPSNTLQEEVKKIKRAVKEADERFRSENDAAIKKLTKYPFGTTSTQYAKITTTRGALTSNIYLFSQAESILKQHGSSATVDIRINNNFFAPSLYRAAANERARRIAIEDIKKEGLNFTVNETVFSSGGREWRFLLSKDSEVISSP